MCQVCNRSGQRPTESWLGIGRVHSRASEQNEHKMGVLEEKMLGFEMIRGQDADAGTQLVVCTLDGFRQRTLGLLLQKVAVLAASTRMCSN